MSNWNRKSVCIGSAAVALAFMLTGSVGAFPIHENRLTFNRPVAPPGIVLPAGTYSFDVVTGTADVVVVRSTRRDKVFYMGFTALVDRPAGMPWNTLVVMGESPKNQAAPITTWYEIDSLNGHQFKY